MKSIEIRLIGKRIEAVDYLKGFSIVTISLMHLLMMMSGIPSVVMKLAGIGGTGVHVFFLCSGIGLYISYLNKKTTFLEFIRKRFLKIYVPYIIVVVISFLVPWMYRSDRVYALLSHIFLYKMFFPQFEESFGVHFWFISTIIQFYMVFIPMCKVKEKLRNNTLFVLMFTCISILWWTVCFVTGVTNIRTWNSFFLQYIWEFAIGMVVAEELFHGRVVKIRTLILLLLAIVGIGLQAAMAMSSEALKIFNDIPALIGYSAFALALMTIPFIKRGALWLSKISYEYFLIHILVFTPIVRLVHGNSIFIQCIIGIIALFLAIAIAYLYNKLIRIVDAMY